MPNVNSPSYGFRFGALNLIGTDAEITNSGYRFWVLDEDGDLGNPEAIEQTIISWLQDGAIVAQRGYDNREIFLQVMVEGSTGTNLALGDAALMLETGKTNTLTYSPADPSAPTSVFSVVTSKLEQVTRAQTERTNEHVYGLRITAEPFARSATMTTVAMPAPSGSQTITSVDDCTSFTNWTSTATGPSGTVTKTQGTTGGYNYVTATSWSTPAVNPWVLSLLRSSLSAAITTTPYIRVIATIVPGSNTAGYPVFRVNNVVVPVAVQEGTTYWLDTTGLGLGSTMTAFSAAVSVTVNSATTTTSLRVFDISRSNVLGTQASGKQLARTVAVAGSARTQASLALEDSANALGETLVYTCPAAAGLVTPNIRQFLSSGNATTVDSTAINGTYTDFSALHTFDIPATGLSPGGYLLLARLKFNGAATGRVVTWAARSRMGSTDLSDPQTGTSSHTLTTLWSIKPIGTMTLPPKKLGISGTVRIELQSVASTRFDEAWLFNLETGRLTWVFCGTASPSAGGSSNRLWLDSPTVASPVPAVYMGTSTDRSDSYHAGSEMYSFGNHEFIPPSMNVFTVTTNSIATSLTLSHYPRWHTHAAA